MILAIAGLSLKLFTVLIHKRLFLRKVLQRFRFVKWRDIKKSDALVSDDARCGILLRFRDSLVPHEQNHAGVIICNSRI